MSIDVRGSLPYEHYTTRAIGIKYKEAANIARGHEKKHLLFTKIRRSISYSATTRDMEESEFYDLFMQCRLLVWMSRCGIMRHKPRSTTNAHNHDKNRMKRNERSDWIDNGEFTRRDQSFSG
ncbi:predicted protein [Lichtheimia corymbifera JMRC:FSU:9682]|uniref:Uncharacterized protein n=1 Tax=Lichtheimia corymbifera JMRC:FSU:9682 TaxID=1263082 RepID=A0A068RR94_9FUNG|nr:predicted protein [Lichtheimia corymbifera JMRC:FSU:9682]